MNTQPITRSSSPGTAETQTSTKSNYEAWVITLVHGRLRFALWLAVFGDFTFVVLDYLLYRSYWLDILWLRAVLLIMMFAGILLNSPHASARRQVAVFLILVWGICFPVAGMTTYIGGFRSSYYAGMTLLIFGSAVLVPVYWRQHVVAQVGVLLFYYFVNIVFAPTEVDFMPAVESTYFIIWTSILSTASVVFYERLLRGEFHARIQLEESNQKLMEMDRLKSEFFANISHELRTPLTLIVGNFRALSNVSLPAGMGQAVESGLRNAVRLLYLINELLDLARFDSGRAVLRKRSIDLALHLRQIASNFESSTRHRIHVQGASQPVIITADSRQIKKVIYNLLSNAVKFSDPSTGEVWARIKVLPASVELQIEDNGIGIAAEHLSGVFDRFSQIEGSITRRQEGTGIGLALVKEVVSEHGGTVDVESRLGEGTTFTITLPGTEASFGTPEVTEAAEDEEDVILPVSAGRPESVEPRIPVTGRPLIVVADDNSDMRQYLLRILEPHYDVALAVDGEQAFELAKTRHPQLILSDIMMPKMSGYDLLDRLRKDDNLRTTPVVFLSALTAADRRLASVQSGVDDIISKPFDENELMVRVRNILAARKQHLEVARLKMEKLLRFLPAPIAKALANEDMDERLRTHRCEVTVVFFDLRGFTSFVEDAEPEEQMEVLREYQTRVGKLVDEYEGTLERFTGDSIMVFFNDPFPIARHHERAISMSVAAQKLLGTMQDEWRRHGFTLGVGIGAAIGYATLGMIGHERRQDYAAIGTVTNLAARLCRRGCGADPHSGASRQPHSRKCHSRIIGRSFPRGLSRTRNDLQRTRNESERYGHLRIAGQCRPIRRECIVESTIHGTCGRFDCNVRVRR